VKSTFSCYYTFIAPQNIVPLACHLFGYSPHSPSIPTQNAPEVLDPAKHNEQLQKKLLELRELVEANKVESAA